MDTQKRDPHEHAYRERPAPPRVTGRCRASFSFLSRPSRCAADIFRPAAPHPYYHLHPLFKPGTLKDIHGLSHDWEELKGKSVILYFGDYRQAKCHNFLPHLLQFYKSINEAGNRQKLEIVFISLDGSRSEFDRHRAMQPWLTIDIDDELTNDFKQHFRVMNPPDVPKFGYGPRTGPPTAIVVGSDGRLLQHLATEEMGHKGLLKWDFTAKRF